MLENLQILQTGPATFFRDRWAESYKLNVWKVRMAPQGGEQAGPCSAGIDGVGDGMHVSAPLEAVAGFGRTHVIDFDGCKGPQPPKSTRLTFDVDVV